MPILRTAHGREIVAICPTRDEARPSVNATGGGDEIKRAGARGGISYCHGDIVAELRLTASPKCVFYFFFLACVSD